MITLIRKISTIAISLTLIFCSFVPAFAEPTEEQYEYVNNKSDAVAAIQAYLNYRGLGVLSDELAAGDEWLINQQLELQDIFSGVEKTAGGILKFRYDYVVLQKLNSFVGDLMQKYNFATFDDENTSVTERAFNGQLFEDDDGNSCLVYYIDSTKSYGIDPQYVVRGTPLKYTPAQLYVGGTFTFNIEGTQFSFTASEKLRNDFPYLSYGTRDAYHACGYPPDATGCTTVFYLTSSSEYYIGIVGYTTPSSVYPARKSSYCRDGVKIPASYVESTYVDVHSPKGVLPDPPEPFEPVIPKDSNGITYNYDNSTTYIDNSIHNNTTYYPSSDEEPDIPDTPTVPDFPGGTWSPDGNGGYDFDFDLPDFSGINWSLNGNSISQKFPFSIPWDLMAFFSVLNAEPETPELQGEIDLGIVTWEIDWDLHQFDGIAAIARNMEFIAFCIGLILATRSLIKG